MARSLFAALLLLLAVPAFADIYKWVDERGTVNFAEDLGKVPPKYRKKVVVIREGEPTSPEVTETIIDQGKERKATGEAEAGKTQAAKPQKKKAVYGGKDEDAWKAEFARLRGQIKSDESEIAERRAKIANPVNMSRGEYLGLQLDVKRLEERLADFRGKLDALTESARKAGVPPELR
ncbi:DUF4124 domain-containing protein [Geobacter sp.]|uniref:DUF4124 domain-containing protein n=1 Tax=Geobacter sp. TaxID=46610 RepID=UPI00261299B8|nr:DUF4124 domain-containing protein [Geobacter sp.]